MPTVSVIVPSFNRCRFLRNSIDSVFQQSFTDWELVVADDGSGDETQVYLDGIAGPKVRVIRLAHCGNPSVVRNAAAAVATGRYLAFLDSDDVWAPSKLEKQLAAMKERPRSRWSYTACRHIDADGRLIPKKQAAPKAPEGWIFENLLRLDIGIAMPTVMTERSLFDEVGGFDEKQRFGEFHDFCLRLSLQSEVAVIREQLCSVRIHSEHYSSDMLANHKDWLQLYEKMAAITSDTGLRRACTRMRADTALKLARAYAECGSYTAAWATLGRAMGFGRSFPGWWWDALKTLLHLLVPNAVIAAVRSRRSIK